MEINEEILRKAIQEILMDLPEFEELIAKPNNKETQKNAYDNIVDLKGYIEKQDVENIKSQVDKSIDSLKVYKKMIDNSLKS